MPTIKENREVTAPVDTIWEIVSDVDMDAEYWKGLGEIKNVRREENLIERTVKVGFMGNEGHQVIKLVPKNTIELIMTKGPLKGSRVTKLESLGAGSTRVSVAWDFQFSRVPIFAQAFVKSQLKEATIEALEKIAVTAERVASVQSMIVNEASADR